MCAAGTPMTAVVDLTGAKRASRNGGKDQSLILSVCSAAGAAGQGSCPRPFAARANVSDSAGDDRPAEAASTSGSSDGHHNRG
jgi:hypothetical protein